MADSADRPCQIAVFCGPQRGHFGSLAPVVAGLRSLGQRLTVYAPAAVQTEARSLGADFVDLYREFPIEAADARSIPIPCRSISHAGHFAAPLIARFERARPDLIIYETFAVHGRLLGHVLGIPHVDVCPVHRLSGRPEELDAIAASRTLRIDAACTRAVACLRQRYGLAGVHPFWYLSARSPYCNLVCEPAPFLLEEERRPFAPLAFFGSLPWSTCEQLPARPVSAVPQVYISFGGCIWDYFADVALQTLRRVALTLRRQRAAEVVIGLGGWRGEPAAWRAELERHGVIVHNRSEQWRELGRADVFVSHHGLKSTHEAIFQQAPMLSLPFFSDQPALASRCQQFGLAEQICPRPLEIPEPEQVLAAFDRLRDTADARAARLTEARQWEIETLRGRPAVLERLLALVEKNPG